MSLDIEPGFTKMMPMEPTTAPTSTIDTTVCMMSGDGAGAMARIVHNGRRPDAVALVYGLVPRPLPACLHCAKACAKDGFKVEWL